MNLLWFGGGFLAGFGTGVTLICCLVIGKETDKRRKDDNN